MLAATTKIRVRYQETDRMGIVYHSNYFVWFEIGRTELFKKIGLSYADLEGRGYFLLVTDARCSYKAPATYEDEIEIITRASKESGSVLTFDYEARKDGGVISTAATSAAPSMYQMVEELKTSGLGSL